MSTSSSLRQQFGAFCTNVPLGVRTLLEAPGLTTTLTAPKTALCVCVSTPGQKVFVHWSNGRGCLEKAPKPATCVCPPLDKGFPSTTPIRQGDQGRLAWPDPTKLQPFVRIFSRDALRTYLQSSSHAVTPLFHGLFHGSSCFHPQNIR